MVGFVHVRVRMRRSFATTTILSYYYSRKIRRGIKFGGLPCNRQIKIRQYFILYLQCKYEILADLKLHIYVWRSLTEPSNLNPPIFLQWYRRFGAQPPQNLIPTNISGYTVFGTCTYIISPGEGEGRKAVPVCHIKYSAMEYVNSYK